MSEQGYIPVEKDVRLYYHVAGDGPQVVLISSAAWLEKDLEPLAQGRTVVFYDQRGRGQSDRDPDPTHIWTTYEIEDMEAVRETVGAARVSIIGWSYMGAVAALYASNYPDRVERLGLICPISPRAPAPYDDPQAAEAKADSRVPTADRKRLAELQETGLEGSDLITYCLEYYRVHRPRQMARPEVANQMRSDPCLFPNEWPQNLAQHHRQHFPPETRSWDWRRRVSKVQVPVLILHGAEDLIPIESSREWAASLPNARLLVLPNVGHYPHLEAPDIFFRAIKSFLLGEWPREAVALEDAELADEKSR